MRKNKIFKYSVRGWKEEKFMKREKHHVGNLFLFLLGFVCSKINFTFFFLFYFLIYFLGDFETELLENKVLNDISGLRGEKTIEIYFYIHIFNIFYFLFYCYTVFNYLFNCI